MTTVLPPGASLHDVRETMREDQRAKFDEARFDFWRNVYSLNYEVIPRLNPNNMTPPPITEPSVSLWTPCNVGQTCPA